MNLDHLTLREGERVGLIGENGAGKSTLLAALSGKASPAMSGHVGASPGRCPPMSRCCWRITPVRCCSSVVIGHLRKMSPPASRFDGAGLSTIEDTPAQYEAGQSRDRDAEARALQISALEMRMAALAARMAQPKKGDRPEEMNAEYMRLVEEIMRLKQRQIKSNQE